MRYLILLLIIGCGNIASAQQKKPIALKISTPNAICAQCKARIEEYLKVEEGVVKVTVYPTSKYTQVLYLADRTNPENIRIAIANIGYDADGEKANEDSYKALPKSCKKPEDGGHKKN